MHSPAYRTWKKRIDAYNAGAEIPKSIIYALCQRVADNSHKNPDDLADLLWRLWARGFAWKITQVQTAQGLRWLNRPDVFRHLSDQERLMVTECFSHFLFVGMLRTSRGNSRAEFAPVYRVCHANGVDTFDYVTKSWRSRKGAPPLETWG